MLDIAPDDRQTLAALHLKGNVFQGMENRLVLLLEVVLDVTDDQLSRSTGLKSFRDRFKFDQRHNLEIVVEATLHLVEYQDTNQEGDS